jgi:hypothetical protein
MADPSKYPFNATELETYKKFFRPPARPNVFKTPESRTALETEQKGLASFLGATDYGQQLEQSQDMGKLQLALALAQRGFAAAGATPKRGESSISTLSRELLSPLAGDAGAVASRMMQQRQALKAAERQEERQLRLAALQNVQRRQEKAFEDDATATQQARQFMQNILKKGDTVSNDYLVEGKNVPLIVRKDYTGKVEGLYDLDGGKIDNTKVKVKPEATATVKPITSWLNDVQVKPVGSSDDQFRDAPGALRIADGTGKNSRVVLDNVSLDFDPNSKTYNARIVKKKSDQSAFYPPKSKSVFLSKPAIELFNLPNNLVGQKATYREYLVKPERRGPNSQSIKELSVAGKTFVFNQHSGYNPATGNITVQRGPDKPPVIYEATQLFREEDPKAYVDVGDPLTVPSGDKLVKIQKIEGLSQIEPGEKLRFQRNAAGGERILYGRQTITLSPAESALFQVRGLDEVQRLDAGQILPTFNKTGELVIPPGKINLIPGSAVGEKVMVEEDQAGNVRYTYKGKVLSDEVGSQLLARPLSSVEKRVANQTIEEWKELPGSQLTVTFENLNELRKVAGLENIKPREKITVMEQQGDPDRGIPRKIRYVYGGTTVEIPNSVLRSGVLRSGDLDTAVVPYVNVSGKELTVGDQTVSPGNRINLSQTQYTQFSTNSPNLKQDLQKATPVDETPSSYMLTQDYTVNNKNYRTGESIRLSPSQYGALPFDIRKVLTDQPERKKVVLRRQELREVWKNLVDTEPSLKNEGEPTESELTSLVAQFPPGSRAVGKKLIEAVFKLISYRKKGDSSKIPEARRTGRSRGSWNYENNAERKTVQDQGTDFEFHYTTARNAPVTPGAVGGMNHNNAFAYALAQLGSRKISGNNAVDTATTRQVSHSQNVDKELADAREKYLLYESVLPNVPWESLNYVQQRAFADLPDVIQLANINALWQKAQDRLNSERQKFTNLDVNDVQAYAATAELLILAKYLRDNSDLSTTGRFFGWFSDLQASTFADIEPITSGGTQRLRSIINAMKTRYQTIAGSEGAGDARPSNFRVALQQDLIPDFGKAETLNKNNLNILINRLETKLRVPFTKEIMTSTVIPQNFETLAAEAGVSGRVNPKLYRWVDPRGEATSLLTRNGVIGGILGQMPFTFKDAQNLVVGQPLPRARNDKVFIKIRNNKDGTVVVQEARADGKPNPKKRLHTLRPNNFNQKQ